MARSKTLAPLALPRRAPKVAQCNPQAWAALPTHAKVLHSLAEQAGLAVAFDGSQWLWAGDVDLFRRSGLFNPSQRWDFQERLANATTGEGIKALLFRASEDPGCIGAAVMIGPIGPRSCERFAALAAADSGYQAFRARMLEPQEVQAFEDEDDARESGVAGLREGWEGPVLVSITDTIAGSYKARRIFPMISAGEWRLSHSMARALLADAERQYGPAFAALRKRLTRELARLEGGAQ